jgi:hypothetical protein
VSRRQWEDAKAKFLRAKHHLEELDWQSLAYLRPDPYVVVVERDLDARSYVVRSYLTRPVPPDIALLLGDVLQNARSALEYLAQYLVVASGEQPINDPGAPNKTQFPVKHKKPANVTELLPGAGEDFCTILDGVQPYTRGDASREHPLAILHELARMDRHHALHVTYVRQGVGPITLTFPGTGRTLAGRESGYWLDDGAVLERIPDPLFDPDAEVQVDGGGPSVRLIKLREPLPGTDGALSDWLDILLQFVAWKVFRPFWPTDPPDHGATSAP